MNDGVNHSNKRCLNLCWLLGTFIQKIGDVRQDHLSHLSSCRHES